MRRRSSAERRFAQVDAAEGDDALLRVVEAHEELRERGLPGAGRPDEREMLARRDRERHARDGGGAAAVREGDVVGGERRACRQRQRAAAHRHRLGEQARDLRERGAAGLELGVPVAEPRDRIEERDQIEGERDDRPDRDPAVPLEVAADDEDRRERERLRERDHREEADVDERDAPPGGDLRARAHAVRGVAVGLPPIRLEDADACEPFLQRRHRLGDPVAKREERRPRPLSVAERRPDEQRHATRASRARAAATA